MVLKVELKNTSPLTLGIKGYASLDVEDEHTALHVGSGCEKVLATPVMIALMEAAAVDCVEHRLPAKHTSLGIHISIDHKAPTPVGHSIKAIAELIEIDDQRLKFNVTAEDNLRTIGSGFHIRCIVKIEEFRRKLDNLKS